jgi:Na+/proline symporter
VGVFWLDWILVIVPLLLVVFIGCRSQKYVKGVSDFLAASRCAGRYVVAVAGGEAAMGLISVIAIVEREYHCGFAFSFWSRLNTPMTMLFGLTGYCVYRFRETRALTMGQFLEMRYNRPLRVFAAILQSISGVVNYALFPAVSARFLIYFLGLPHRIMIGGINLPCYGFVVVLCLTLAVLFIWPAGRISLIITDCFQGLLCYPIFVVIIGYIILKFSWTEDIAPVMLNRVPGQSFMNPYDISQLRDFNLFALVVSLTASLLCRANWFGNDTTNSAKSAHEQKMAGVLGAWRSGMSQVFILLVAVICITFMTSPHFVKTDRFKANNTQIRVELSSKVLDELIPDAKVREPLIAKIKAVPGTLDEAHYNKKMSQQNNMDTPYLNAMSEAMGDSPDGRIQFQKFRSLYNQMMMPTLLGKIFPVGMIGVFCLLMVMLLISTDDSRIFNASSTLMQDLVLPLFKGHLDQKMHLLLLRLMTVWVALFFLVVSLFFAQLDYINMFTTIMCAIWMGGAGPVMLGGLYTRFGNLTGSWCAIILGSGTSLMGLICQRNWADNIYPFLEKMQWVSSIDEFLRAASAPFNPWIVWTMNPVKFPINSYEIYFISMILSVTGYVGGSYLTYKPYNLDKLLHRGEYADGPKDISEPWTLRNIFSKIIGITPEYTKGDRIIAYSVFCYSFVYGVIMVFVAIVIWNAFWRWPNSWWTVKFYITSLLVPAIIGIISTVWFMWGGIKDSRQLFIDLENRVEDPDDNGQVSDETKADLLK